jgi:hypothetical protein
VGWRDRLQRQPAANLHGLSKATLHRKQGMRLRVWISHFHTLTFGSDRAARITSLPMRPNPLMPILSTMLEMKDFDWGFVFLSCSKPWVTSQKIIKLDGETIRELLAEKTRSMSRLL